MLQGTSDLSRQNNSSETVLRDEFKALLRERNALMSGYDQGLCDEQALNAAASINDRLAELRRELGL